MSKHYVVCPTCKENNEYKDNEVENNTIECVGCGAEVTV